MFPLKIGDGLKVVTKITNDQFTTFHREVLATVRFENGNLVFVDNRWCSLLLGAGEEKAVFGVCDQDNHIFALEVIDERTYLNGRFVGGQYFGEMRVESLRNIKADPKAMLGLTFTGRVKMREFVYGYEWARFQFDPQKPGGLDSILTAWLQTWLGSRFNFYQEHYKDVHDRNVMFEVRRLKEDGVLVPMKDCLGKLKLIKVGLQPIDVR